MNKRHLSVAIIILTASYSYAQNASTPQDAPPVDSPEPAPAISVNSLGLIFSSPDGADTLHVHGYVQADDRMFLSNLHGEPLDTFLFRRIRPLFEGTLFHAIDFRFMPDFGQNNPQIQEAYVEWKTLSFAKVRAGKFKEPIGLEVDRSDRDLTLAERSLVSDLVPLRYMGAEINGSALSNSISYAAGYFNGSSDGSNGNFQWIPDNEFAGRVFLLPFTKTKVSALRQFGIGIAGSSANQHGTIVGMKTIGQSTFFKYSSSTLANGSHTRITPQAYYYGGPVGLMGEYAISSQDVVSKTNTANINNQAWEVTGSVMLTGEKNSYGNIHLRHNFEPLKDLHHWGAFEIATRYSQLRIGSNAFPLFASMKSAAQEAQEHAIGMNWYLNRFIKLTTDYEHTTFRMASTKVTPLHNEDVLMNRVQLVF